PRSGGAWGSMNTPAPLRVTPSRGRYQWPGKAGSTVSLDCAAAGVDCGAPEPCPPAIGQVTALAAAFRVPAAQWLVRRLLQADLRSPVAAQFRPRAPARTPAATRAGAAR